jgi:branched-chain amino acid transport system substrate-binding protein
MLKNVLLAAVGILTLVTGASAQDAPPIRIGYSIAKTGLFATAAPSQLTAYEFWRDQVNAKGGLDVAGVKRKIEFVEYDDQSNPGNAVKIYEKLITSDKVDLLLAPWGTPTHLAVVPVLERFGVPMVGNTASSVHIRELKVKNVWFVSPSVHDKLAAEMVKMAKANGVKSAAVIANVLPQGKEIKRFLIPEIEKAGIELKVNEEYPPDIKDLTALLTKVKTAQPDAIWVLSYPADTVLYTRQAKELGIAARLQWLAIGPAIPFYRKMFGPGADGIVTMGHWSPWQEHWPLAKPFYDAYVARFGQEPDYLDTVLAYMSCQVLEQAVAKAGTNNEKLRKTIATETFETINGPVKFNGVENAVTPAAFLQVQGGKLQIVWPESIATSKFTPKTTW